MSTQPLTLSTDTMQSTIKQYFAASRGKNKVKEMVACLAENCVVHDPAEAPAFEGRTEVHQFLQTIVDLFATVELTEEFISINGHEAAVKWAGHGIGKNGCEVKFEGIDLFEFNANGKVQVLRGFWNPAAVLAKLAELQTQPQLSNYGRV